MPSVGDFDITMWRQQHYAALWTNAKGRVSSFYACDPDGILVQFAAGQTGVYQLIGGSPEARDATVDQKALMNDGPQITPFLWIEGRAREAADFYVSTFRDAYIVDDSVLPEGPGAGSHTVSFVVKGQHFITFDGIPAYEFTPAISFVVNCESQEEIDEYWDRLAEDGSPIQCGWIQDKFGVHWQIIPSELTEFLKDEARSTAVLNDLLPMVKIDMERLRRTYQNA